MPDPVTLLRSYKVELDPNNTQRTAFKRHAGAARFVWNWALAECKRDYEERKLTTLEGEIKALTPFDLDSRLPIIKTTTHPWLAELSAQSIRAPLPHLQTAFRTFFKNVKAGKKPGYPRFKKRGVCRTSFQFPEYVTLTDSSIKLPKIGRVRLKEHGYVPTDRPVKTVTISERAGRWYASVLIGDVDPVKVETTGSVLGIDLGVTTLAVCSDGTQYENSKHLGASQRSIRKLSKRLSRQKKGSVRRAKTRARLAKVHARVGFQRSDAIHKMTSEIVKTKRPSAIVIEDLNVSGMTKNHCLARAISGASFGEIRRQLTYKTEWYGVRLIMADRFYPSSKTCSGCGAVKTVLDLWARTYCCDSCGLSIDRDVNAALNLQAYGGQILAGGTPVTARGGIVRPAELALTADLVEARTDLRVAS
jgi:putative transposase